MIKKIIKKIKGKIFLYRGRKMGLELNPNKWKIKPYEATENTYIGNVRLFDIFPPSNKDKND